MPPATSAAVSTRTLAADGFTLSASFSVATARAAESNKSIRPGKASRKNPDIRSVTSTLGRSNTLAGITSNPVTRRLAVSHVGCTPMSAKAWAMSSPPVRIFEVPQALNAMVLGQTP